MAGLDAFHRPIYGMNRLLNESGQNFATSSLSQFQADGNRSWQAETKACESVSGRLRLARRGDKLFHLFAEEDSPVFRIFHTDEVSARANQTLWNPDENDLQRHREMPRHLDEPDCARGKNDLVSRSARPRRGAELSRCQQ